MGRSTPVQVGDTVYPSKSAVTKTCQKILNGYTYQGTIIEKDAQFLDQLLMRHPRADEKRGCGVRRFYVSPDGFKGRCFRVERIDGSDIDFSFITCINGKPRTLKSSLAEACRQAILPQIFEFRDRVMLAFNVRGYVKCSISGQQIWDSQAIHIDHYPVSFASIFELFLTSLEIRGESPSESWVTSDERGTRTIFATTVKAQTIKAEFEVFHMTHIRRTNGLKVTEMTAHLRASNVGSKRVKGDVTYV
jgi:hypothetical protein